MTDAEKGLAMLADIHAACATALAMMHTPDTGEIVVGKDKIKMSSLSDDNELIVRYTLNDTWGLRMVFNRLSQELDRAFLVNNLSGDQYPVSDTPVGR